MLRCNKTVHSVKQPLRPADSDFAAETVSKKRFSCYARKLFQIGMEYVYILSAAGYFVKICYP